MCCIEMLVEFLFRIPTSNSFVERIFSVLGSLCWVKRNRLTPDYVTVELLICKNLKTKCEMFRCVCSKM